MWSPVSEIQELNDSLKRGCSCWVRVRNLPERNHAGCCCGTVCQMVFSFDYLVSLDGLWSWPQQKWAWTSPGRGQLQVSLKFDQHSAPQKNINALSIRLHKRLFFSSKEYPYSDLRLSPSFFVCGWAWKGSDHFGYHGYTRSFGLAWLSSVKKRRGVGGDQKWWNSSILK